MSRVYSADGEALREGDFYIARCDCLGLGLRTYELLDEAADSFAIYGLADVITPRGLLLECGGCGRGPWVRWGAFIRDYF